MYTPQKTNNYNFLKHMFLRMKQVNKKVLKRPGFLIWPFWNGQAISKPLKSFKMAMAVSSFETAKGFETASNMIFKKVFIFYTIL